MKIKKVISNNAVLAVDSKDHDVVVLGSGVGWRKTVEQEIDLERVERTFYDMDDRYLEMLGQLPENVLLASADVVEQAEVNLECDLNPNLPVTLADHLQFAIERMRKDVRVNTPLAYDVEHLYPREAELGMLALDILQDYTGLRLPESEVTGVALHLINAEMEGGNLHSMMMAVQIIADIDKIVERDLGVVLNKRSFYYSRFTMHLRYLIQRLEANAPAPEVNAGMLRETAREYPDVYTCARHIAAYFKRKWGWRCSDEEVLYLMLHINRVKQQFV